MVERSWLTPIRFPWPTLATRKPFRLLNLNRRACRRDQVPGARVRERPNGSRGY